MGSGSWRRARRRARAREGRRVMQRRQAADSIVERGPWIAQERYAVKDFGLGIGSTFEP